MALSVHEYQAKEIFKRYAIPVNQSQVASTPEEAYEIAKKLNGPGIQFAVKAQIHAGGRGKGGGIKLVRNPDEVKTAAQAILGKTLITPQTGSEGKPVSKVLVELTSPLKQEFYASMVLDRARECPCLILSKAGGMDIEEVAEKDPSKIVKYHFSPENGLPPAEALKIAQSLSVTTEQAKTFSEIFVAMSKIFLDLDTELLEINPLAITDSGKVIAIDAKINFEENSLFRHPDVVLLRDVTQEDSREVEAKKFDLSYVGLEGSIGCIVNGAGLAMATMDIIKYAGGAPANFLDVGGGANKEKVAAAFKIILKDPHVRAILVNIFGGIMRCDVVAEGILAAVSEIGVKVPLVVRLEGTNVEEGKAILKKSGLNIIAASTFAEAAEKVVAQTR